MSDHPSQESLGERIRRLRKERKFSITKMAEEIGITKSWLSRVELDQETPSSVLLNKIALFLKVPIRELLQDMEEQMELESRMKLVEVLLESNQADEAEGIIESLQRHEELREGDEIRLAVLLGECRYLQKRYTEALELLLPLATKLESANHHDAHILAMIRYIVGKSYFQIRDFTNAHYNYRKAYEFTERFPAFDLLAAKISNNFAVTLRIIDRSSESIHYLNKAYTFFSKNDDLRSLASTLFEQGIVYKNIQDYSKASACFDQAKAIWQALDLKSLFVVAQHTVASEITVHNDPSLALKQLNECIQLLLEENDYVRMVLVYSKLATVHLKQNNPSEAMSHLQRANDLVVQHSLQNVPQTGEFYKSLAQYHYSSQNYNEAVDYALISSDIYDKLGLFRDQIDSLQIAADAHLALGNYMQAFQLERMGKHLYSKLYERKGLL